MGGASDYHADVRCSKEIFKQLSQNYLKFRNTARYCLGNLEGFDPNHLVEPEQMPELDRWALTKLERLIAVCRKAYDHYEFHVVSHAINDFCVVELSSFYLDIIKDRLYCEDREGLKRRSAQTALYLIVDAMAKLFAPILAFTCDGSGRPCPHRAEDDPRNILLNRMPESCGQYAPAPGGHGEVGRGDSPAPGCKRRAGGGPGGKRIGKALEAHVSLEAQDDAAGAALEAVRELDLAEICIVSSCALEPVPEEATQGQGPISRASELASPKPRAPNAPVLDAFPPGQRGGACVPRCAGVVSRLPQDALELRE